VTQLEEQPAGATPLSAEDLTGLKLSWVTTHGELNWAEADDILQGRSWAFRRRGSWWYLGSDQLQALHRRMFGDVWKWAGKLRLRDTNIGIDPYRITVALRDLCEDAIAQIGDGQNLAYPADELAVRFHHRLVLIHPFPNGNGRHSRLATDLLIRDLGRNPFSWGGTELTSASDARSRYLDALRAADRDLDVAPLLRFVRSGQ
jgi:Fic-DOC domain mobile mystery protein B